MNDDLITIEEALVLIACQEPQLSAECQRVAKLVKTGNWKSWVDAADSVPSRLARLGFGETETGLPDNALLFRSGQRGRCP